MLVVLLALPALRGDDKKADQKDPPPKVQDDKKPLSAKQQYQSLVQEFNSKRNDLVKEIQKAKGPAQQKLIQSYMEVGKDYADKFYKLAEENPKDAIALESIFWILQNGG